MSLSELVGAVTAAVAQVAALDDLFRFLKSQQSSVLAVGLVRELQLRILRTAKRELRTVSCAFATSDFLIAGNFIRVSGEASRDESELFRIREVFIVLDTETIVVDLLRDQLKVLLLHKIL